METSSIKTPFPGRVSVPSSFVSLFIFYVLSYLLSKTMGCFSGRLMSSASDQKLFCEVCSAFNYSFDEFVGEKVVSPSYSSAILASPCHSSLLFVSVLRFGAGTIVLGTVHSESLTTSLRFQNLWHIQVVYTIGCDRRVSCPSPILLLTCCVLSAISSPE